MKIEYSTDLLARAARHAALADPARLQIADVLSLGDASPSELQRLLNMPSNLLSHHLNVLETEGMITRVRSEADRRRTYVRLQPAAFDRLLPGTGLRTHRVVFVCTANSARSQLAAALWRRASLLPVASAGIEPADRVDPQAVAAARRQRLPLHATRPKHLAEVKSEGDLIITVCDNAHERLGDVRGLHWSVPDPVTVGTDDAYDAALSELARRVNQFAPRLAPAS
jgi:protein-tyrosine-phosphatase